MRDMITMITVSDMDRSVRFYRDILGLAFIAQYDPPGLAFFRIGTTRLLLEKSNSGKPSDAVLYFEVPDIDKAHDALKEKGIHFDSAPHLIFPDDAGTFGPPGEEEWMAFFKDNDGRPLGIMSQAK